MEGYRILMTYSPAIFCEIQNLDNEHTYTVTLIQSFPNSLSATQSTGKKVSLAESKLVHQQEIIRHTNIRLRTPIIQSLLCCRLCLVSPETRSPY